MSLFHKDKKPEQVKSFTKVIVVQASPWGTDLHGTAVSYSDLYLKSFAVRSVTDFIARHVSRYHPRSYQVDSTGEHPLSNDAVADLFRNPATGVSRHELMRHLALGVMVTGNSYAPLLTDGEGRVRGITPTGAQVSLKREGGGPPEKYLLQTGFAEPTKVDPKNILHCRTWSPTDPFVGASPLDSLRTLLAEERAAGDARTRMWLRGLRRDGVIEQHIETRPLSDEARSSYLIDIEDAIGGTGADPMPLMLEPGHTWKDSSFSPEEAQFAEARNLTLRAVAGCYGLPAQLVNAEGRNLRTGWREVEQALGPWANLIESAVNSQLVPRLYPGQAPGRIRVRFESPAPLTDNEIGQTLDSAVKSGRITPDEARAVTGLPPIAGGDRLYPQPGATPA